MFARNYPARIHHSCHRSQLCNSSSCGKTPVYHSGVWEKSARRKTIRNEQLNNWSLHIAIKPRYGFSNTKWKKLKSQKKSHQTLSLIKKYELVWIIGHICLLADDLRSIHLHQCSCRSKPGWVGSHLHPDRWCTGLIWCRHSVGPGSSPWGICTARQLHTHKHTRNIRYDEMD